MDSSSLIGQATLAEVVFNLSISFAGRFHHQRAQTKLRFHRFSRMKLSSSTIIFLVLGLLFASLTVTSSRETPAHGVPEKGWSLSRYVTCIAYHGSLYAWAIASTNSMQVLLKMLMLFMCSGRDRAMVQPEGVIYGLARVSPFTPPAPAANHHPDPPFNNPWSCPSIMYCTNIFHALSKTTPLCWCCFYLSKRVYWLSCFLINVSWCVISSQRKFSQENKIDSAKWVECIRSYNTYMEELSARI